MHRRIQTLGYVVAAAIMTFAFACNASEPASSSTGAAEVRHPGQPTLTAAPESGSPGTDVLLTGTGYEPNAQVQIGVGPVNSEFSIIGQAQTDAQGQLRTTVSAPTWMQDNQRIVFVATQENASWKVISNEFRMIDRPERETGDGQITLIGTLTAEGVECQAMRGEDGQLYTLLGDLVGFSAGTRVRITGTVAEVSFCMQGKTINVRAIERL